MKNPKAIMLAIAACITGLLVWFDFEHDNPPTVPVSLWQNITEIVVFGGMYTAVFYFIMLGIYRLFTRP